MTGLVPPIPQTFAEAVAAWAAFPDDSLPASLKLRAWKSVVDLLDQELIEPLRQQAREEADPTKRNQLMITAQLSAMLHLLLARLTTGLAKSNSADGPAALSGFPRGEFQQARAMVDQIHALTRESHTGTPKRKAKPASRGNRERPHAPCRTRTQTQSCRTHRAEAAGMRRYRIRRSWQDRFQAAVLARRSPAGKNLGHRCRPRSPSPAGTVPVAVGSPPVQSRREAMDSSLDTNEACRCKTTETSGHLQLGRDFVQNGWRGLSTFGTASLARRG